MNRMECVRMSVEEDNGRERGEEKQEKNGNRKEYGNKEDNRGRVSNQRECLQKREEEEERRVALKWNRMKDEMRIEWEREDDAERNEWEE